MLEMVFMIKSSGILAGYLARGGGLSADLFYLAGAFFCKIQTSERGVLPPRQVEEREWDAVENFAIAGLTTNRKRFP